MGAGVQPGCASAHDLDPQVAAGQVGLVDVGDFQLAAGGGRMLRAISTTSLS